MARPTISVITAAHPARARNGMLLEAQKSVGQQTLMPDAHIIAMDVDGEGAAPTRDRALRSVRTEWTAVLDSDDLFLPKHLEWLMRHAEATSADLVYSWFKLLQVFPDGTHRVLEDDPIFPVTHYLNPFDPANPIETTVTVLVRTELAQQVGYHALDRGEVNSGEDRAFLLGCLALGADIQHLVRKSWLWRHHAMPGVVTTDGKPIPGNTSGLPSKGDAAA